MTKKWTINKKGIMNSVEKVITKKDIKHLTKDAYNFVSCMSGFIAHYNHYGFMEHYENVADFVNDLKWSSDTLRPDYYTTDRFFSEGEQKEYYADKSEILRFIKDLIENIEVKTEMKEFTFTSRVASY